MNACDVSVRGGQQPSGQQCQAAPSAMGSAAGPYLPDKKNTIVFLVQVLREFTELYGALVVVLENLHEFDTWSWQLLIKVVETLPDSVLVLATSRPQHDLPASSVSGATGGAAHSLSAKNVNLYRSLLKLSGISKLFLEPFNFMQTRALMKVCTLPF
jgi:predicted ATPase